MPSSDYRMIEQEVRAAMDAPPMSDGSNRTIYWGPSSTGARGVITLNRPVTKRLMVPSCTGASCADSCRRYQVTYQWPGDRGKGETTFNGIRCYDNGTWANLSPMQHNAGPAIPPVRQASASPLPPPARVPAQPQPVGEDPALARERAKLAIEREALEMQRREQMARQQPVGPADAASPAVVAIQEGLAVLRYYQGDASGRYDAATQSAAAEFAVDYRLAEVDPGEPSQALADKVRQAVDGHSGMTRGECLFGEDVVACGRREG